MSRGVVGPTVVMGFHPRAVVLLITQRQDITARYIAGDVSKPAAPNRLICAELRQQTCHTETRAESALSYRNPV
jgi:hypothetical protein